MTGGTGWPVLVARGVHTGISPLLMPHPVIEAEQIGRAMEAVQGGTPDGTTRVARISWLPGDWTLLSRTSPALDRHGRQVRDRGSRPVLVSEGLLVSGVTNPCTLAPDAQAALADTTRRAYLQFLSDERRYPAPAPSEPLPLHATRFDHETAPAEPDTPWFLPSRWFRPSAQPYPEPTTILLLTLQGTPKP
ncbi:hypothetical protein [Actinomadura oligospora]|uniref:hypothetical protein n=1 Tax=Actinomadura oligospora TaxID=111804 RepID=UPI00047873F9|nr:hypothetical protein [Actinomadura oligospora]